MRILFLTSAHNSLSQRLLIELTERGHRNPRLRRGDGRGDDRRGLARRAGPDHCADAEDRHSRGGLVALSLPDRASRHQRRSRPVLARLGHRQSTRRAGAYRSWRRRPSSTRGRSGRRTSFPSKPILPRRAASIVARSPRPPCAASSRRSHVLSRASSNPDRGSPRSCPMRCLMRAAVCARR